MREEQSQFELDQQIKQFIQASYGFHQPIVQALSSGMNNTTRVIMYEGKKYNFRIYNNHRDTAKLIFEHHILEQLQQLKLAIQTPIPYKNVKQQTFSTLDDGSLAAMFEYIEGILPNQGNLLHMQGLAYAAGLLSRAFEHIQIDYLPSYTPYYDLSSNYAPFNKQQIEKLTTECSLLKGQEQSLLKLMEERNALENCCHFLKQLPHNWVHGDINTSNAVAREQEVVGILDFEFVTRDLRAMELAVLLADSLGQDFGIHQRLQAIIQGFCSAQPLTAHEMEYMPELVKLRLIDVAMHFIHRFEMKLDDEQTLYQILCKKFKALQQVEEMKDTFKVLPRISS